MIALKYFYLIYLFVLLVISPLLALFLLGYIIVRQLFFKPLLFDLSIFCLAISIIYANSKDVINYLNVVYEHYKTLGLIQFTLYQMQHFNLQHLALLIFLVLPVVIVNSVLELNKNSEKNILPNNSHTSDQDGVLLANDPNLEFLSDHELNQHTLIVGTTGSGKTTTLLNFVISAATRNIPLIFLDGKGSIDLIDQLAQIAAKHQRKFKVFTLRPRAGLANLAGYNPFASGNATEWKNRIMTLFAAVEGKGQEHFSLGEQNYINFVANILAKLNRKVDLRVFLGFLENPEKLLAIAHETMPELGKKIAKLQQDSELNTLIGDVVKLLELFIYSDYGYLFNTLDMENVIILRESIVNKEIVLFQFDASTYPEDSKKVAKMVISDINSVFASFNHSTKCYCIFDEFASYASSNLAETISLHRSNGMHAVIGTQSIETVKLKSNETKRIAEELIACCNTYIIHALNHYQDATIMANIMGWQKEPDISHTISKAELNSSDKISQHIKMIDTHKISIDTLMELKTGDAIIYRKVAGILPHKVKIQRLQA